MVSSFLKTIFLFLEYNSFLPVVYEQNVNIFPFHCKLPGDSVAKMIFCVIIKQT